MPNKLLSSVLLGFLLTVSPLWAYKDPFVPIEPAGKVEETVKIPEVPQPPSVKKWPVSNPVVNVKPLSKQPKRKEDEEDKIVRPDLDISGLFWGGKYNLAIIQDKIFYEGDKYDEICTIVSITNGKLILKCQDKVWIYETKERDR